MKTVICSHGFGVMADARGMFTEIAHAFPDYNFKRFDYNEVLPNGNIVVQPLHKQAEKLQQVIEDTNDHEIVLLCHSQGSIIAGLINLDKISKIILLAPPTEASMQRVVSKISKRPGATYNPEGVSQLPRTDGTTTLLPKDYIESLDLVNPFELYEKIADTKQTIIIRATKDNVLGETNVGEINKATLVDLPADHDFTGKSRAELIATLRNLL